MKRLSSVIVLIYVRRAPLTKLLICGGPKLFAPKPVMRVYW